MTGLKQVVDENQTFAGRVFDFTVQFLIVLSLITFSIETLPDLSTKTKRTLHYIEIVTVVAFTIEYVARLIIAERKFSFVFSFFGLIDLIAVLPFYVASGIDLRAIRIFRLLRLFRILKLVRYSKAIQRFHRAFKIAREEIVLFLCVTAALLFLAAVGIYYFENRAQPQLFSSVFHCLWWAVVTLTTVGYGDVYPITLGGRIFTFFILIIGLGVISVPAGLVASALSKARELED